MGQEKLYKDFLRSSSKDRVPSNPEFLIYYIGRTILIYRVMHLGALQKLPECVIFSAVICRIVCKVVSVIVELSKMFLMEWDWLIGNRDLSQLSRLQDVDFQTNSMNF